MCSGLPEVWDSLALITFWLAGTAVNLVWCFLIVVNIAGGLLHHGQGIAPVCVDHVSVHGENVERLTPEVRWRNFAFSIHTRLAIQHNFTALAIMVQLDLNVKGRELASAFPVLLTLSMRKPWTTGGRRSGNGAGVYTIQEVHTLVL